MQYITEYTSPLGEIIISADEAALTGLWFAGQKYAEEYAEGEFEQKITPVLEMAQRWLDVYFSGREPDFEPPLHFTGTPFQMQVWNILCSIPYGETVTYGEIAAAVAKSKGLERMSAQAVGNAVGRNKISLIVPCHRVVGANGGLVGYAGGVSKKQKLLTLEATAQHKTKGTVATTIVDN